MTTLTTAKLHKNDVARVTAIRFALGVALSALSGAMLLLAFPPYGLWPLMWVACVPYRYAQHRLLPLKWSSLAESVALLVWLGPFMARMFGMDNGVFFYLLGLFIATLVFFLSRDRKFQELTHYRWFILFGVVAWVGFEMIRATFIPLVATSAFIGYTQSTQPWITRPVSIFSVYGLDLLIMLVNFALAQALMAWSDRHWPFQDTVSVPGRQARRGLVLAGALLAVWFGTSLLLWGTTSETATVRVAAIQPGYSQPAWQDEVNGSAERFAVFAEDAREAVRQGARIIFTPEMMFNFDPRVAFTEQFRGLANELDAYIFIDYTVAMEGEEWRNESVLLSPAGAFSAVYGKNEVPPGEPATPSAGVYPVFTTPLGRLATMICHDANYTETARRLAGNGAQLVSAGLNEFGGFGEQYWTNVSFRAIENRMAMVVAARETGSAIIDPDGRVVALDIEPGKHVVLVGDVTLGPGGAPYTGLGDILGWVALALYAGLIVYQYFAEKRPAIKAELAS